MDINNIPIVGKIHQTLSTFVLNFIILGVVTLVLGVLIPFFPQILDFLVAITLITLSAVFFNIAWHIHAAKKKYLKPFDK